MKEQPDDDAVDGPALAASSVDSRPPRPVGRREDGRQVSRPSRGLTAPAGSGSPASRTRNRAAVTAIEALEELTDTPAEMGLPDVVDRLVPAAAADCRGARRV